VTEATARFDEILFIIAHCERTNDGSITLCRPIFVNNMYFVFYLHKNFE